MCQNDISQTFLKLIIFTFFRKDWVMGWKIKFNLWLLIAVGFGMSEIYCRLYCIISIAIFFISFIIWGHVFCIDFEICWMILNLPFQNLSKSFITYRLVNQNRIFFSTKKLENQNFLYIFIAVNFFYSLDFQVDVQIIFWNFTGFLLFLAFA